MVSPEVEREVKRLMVLGVSIEDDIAGGFNTLCGGATVSLDHLLARDQMDTWASGLSTKQWSSRQRNRLCFRRKLQLVMELVDLIENGERFFWFLFSCIFCVLFFFNPLCFFVFSFLSRIIHSLDLRVLLFVVGIVGFEPL